MGTCEYVIGIIHDKEIWYYVSDRDEDGKELKSKEQFSSFLVDAKRYGDEVLLVDDLANIHLTLTRKVLEIQKCPKCGREFTEHPAISRDDNETEICPQCGREFTEHPAISRDDNETEICPQCGVREALEAYHKATRK